MTHIRQNGATQWAAMRVETNVLRDTLCQTGWLSTTIMRTFLTYAAGDRLRGTTKWSDLEKWLHTAAPMTFSMWSTLPGELIPYGVTELRCMW